MSRRVAICRSRRNVTTRATGCAHIASRRANLAVVSQSKATTLPCLLSRGIRSTTVKMDEKLYLLLNLALYLRRRMRRHRRSVWVHAIFRIPCHNGSSTISLKKCASNTSKLSIYHRQGNERTASMSFSSQSILRCTILYSAPDWHVKCKYG